MECFGYCIGQAAEKVVDHYNVQELLQIRISAHVQKQHIRKYGGIRQKPASSRS